jgi:hypothetical protein
VAYIWLLFNSKLVLLFQTYNIILYVHAFLFCWHFSYRTFCKTRSDWLQLQLAENNIITRGVTVKIQQVAVRGNYGNQTNDAKGEDE